MRGNGDEIVPRANCLAQLLDLLPQASQFGVGSPSLLTIIQLVLLAPAWAIVDVQPYRSRPSSTHSRQKSRTTCLPRAFVNGFSKDFCGRDGNVCGP